MFNKLVLFVTAIVLFTAVCSQAQHVQGTRKYRVVAYKKGNNAITSMSNTTEVVPYMNVYIPNTFTPNGDGLNDTFGIHGEAIREFSMQVYNRWGQVIFESAGIEDRWDGKHEGNQVPQGSYVYHFTAKGITGSSTSRNGTVNVIY